MVADVETGTVTSADGTTIAYERSGAGPPILLVDAAGQFRGTGTMRALAEVLAEKLTIYCYDRRGRGESADSEPYAVDREIDDLAALIEVAGGSAAVHGFSSGAALALHAGAAGLPITRLSLLEPAVDLDHPAGANPPLADEVHRLVAEGRRGEAYLHFLRDIGVPEEFVDQTRQSPVWPELQALAHTLAYDAQLTGRVDRELLGRVAAPVVVINSAETDAQLLRWGHQVAEALPDGRQLSLPGEWHGVDPAVLAPVIVEHVRGEGSSS